MEEEHSDVEAVGMRVQQVLGRGRMDWGEDGGSRDERVEVRVSVGNRIWTAAIEIGIETASHNFDCDLCVVGSGFATGIDSNGCRHLQRYCCIASSSEV